MLADSMLFEYSKNIFDVKDIHWQEKKLSNHYAENFRHWRNFFPKRWISFSTKTIYSLDHQDMHGDYIDYMLKKKKFSFFHFQIAALKKNFLSIRTLASNCTFSDSFVLSNTFVLWKSWFVSSEEEFDSFEVLPVRWPAWFSTRLVCLILKLLN